MRPIDDRVSRESEYFVHSPSESGKNAFLYPTYIGHSLYEPGYRLRRSSFDSYFIMYVMRGILELETADTRTTVHEDSFVILNCYLPHAYSAPDGADVLWVHFDGPLCGVYYQMIVKRLGQVFRLEDNNTNLSVLQTFSSLYHQFSKSDTQSEAMLSKLLHDLIYGFLLYEPAKNHATTQSLQIQKCMAYISAHFQKELSNEMLARIALVSPYHFIRVFKKETGFTPHEYITNLRMSNARTLLRKTDLPVKEICFQSGFQNVSVFCVAFRNHEGMTPLEYRNKITDVGNILSEI